MKIDAFPVILCCMVAKLLPKYEYVRRRRGTVTQTKYRHQKDFVSTAHRLMITRGKTAKHLSKRFGWRIEMLSSRGDKCKGNAAQAGPQTF